MRLIRPVCAAALTAAFLLGGCDDSSATAPQFSSCVTEGPTVDILDNHLPSGGDHLLVVAPEEVVAAVEVVYDIRGDNVGHTHSVTLTEEDFLSLQEGASVTVVSSNNGSVGASHDHTIVLSCP